MCFIHHRLATVGELLVNVFSDFLPDAFLAATGAASSDHVGNDHEGAAAVVADEAEAFLKKDKLSDEDTKKVAAELMDGAREQLEMAELLGYGEDEEHEKFHRQIADLQSKIDADQETNSVEGRLAVYLCGRVTQPTTPIRTRSQRL